MGKSIMNKLRRQPRRYSLAGIIIILLVFAALLFSLSKPANLSDAQDGVLDITEWRQDGLVHLDGEWEFYWDRHLTYADFRQDPNIQPDLLAEVPNEWNGYRLDDRKLSGAGFATYRLKVKFRDYDKELALKILPMATAYRIYVNDLLIASNGLAGQHRGEFKASGKPNTIMFTAPSESFELIVHVSNFDYAKGGFNRSILLGSTDYINDYNQGLAYKDFFLLGSLIIAVFYSISMYLMNRDEKISLYFGLVCLLFLCRIPLTSSYSLYEFLPSATHQWSEWINYNTFHLAVLCYALMIQCFFPERFPERISRLLIIVTVIIVVLLTVLPLSVYSQFYLVSDAIGLLVLAYPNYVIITSFVRRKSYSGLIFFGNGLLLSLVILDIVNTELNRYEMGFFSNYGIIVFTFVYAFILARRFSLSFKESKVLSRRLLELDRLKDEFLANTSHELKTPLQGIVSISESLIAGAEGPMTQRQVSNLGLVASSGRRLTQLINDILDLSQLKNGNIQLNLRDIHVKPLVEFVLQVCEKIYVAKKISWRHEIPDELPSVYADENRLVQILFNLVGNAAKFTEQGEVTVKAEARLGMVEISVSDTGIGIRPEQLEEVFKPFTQADASAIRLYGGVGLGLSIVKHLVQLHNGEIEVESTLGEGSRFTFKLPAGHEPEVNQINVEAVAPLHSQMNMNAADYNVIQSGEHILIVDDDPANLQSASNLLKLDGYTVTAAASGGEALDIIRRHPDIRLVILDVMMPLLSGFEVCRIIRETKTAFELPVLMVTAKHLPEDLALGLEAGANDYLVKPYEPVEFKARVRTLIELNRSIQKALKSELAFLQAQIKPHFIYNTINTISYYCTRDGEKANELLERFAEYLRSSFDFKNLENDVSIAREMDFVNTYVEIEKSRFEDRLQTIFDIEEGLEGMRIPRLVLQPLVENAILHGVTKKVEGGLVKVAINREHDDIVFHVTDTGVGIATERLEKLLTDAGEEQGVGLRNIHMRLISIYGDGLHISSQTGSGTQISFKIPCER